MKQIIRYRRQENADYDYVDESTLTQAEEQYQVLVFKKEEALLRCEQEYQTGEQQIEDLVQKLLQLEQDCNEKRRLGSNFDLEALRVEDRSRQRQVTRSLDVQQLPKLKNKLQVMGINSDRRRRQMILPQKLVGGAARERYTQFMD